MNIFLKSLQPRRWRSVRTTSTIGPVDTCTAVIMFPDPPSAMHGSNDELFSLQQPALPFLLLQPSWRHNCQRHKGCDANKFAGSLFLTKTEKVKSQRIWYCSSSSDDDDFGFFFEQYWLSTLADIDSTAAATGGGGGGGGDGGGFLFVLSFFLDVTRIRQNWPFLLLLLWVTKRTRRSTFLFFF